MAKLSLKAFGVLLKKMAFLSNYKFASKSDLVNQIPYFDGDKLVFPAGPGAHLEGESPVLNE